MNEEQRKELETEAELFAHDQVFDRNKFRGVLTNTFISGAEAYDKIIQPEIERLKAALQEIHEMKLLHDNEDHKYAFNRCWHVADKALSKNI